MYGKKSPSEKSGAGAKTCAGCGTKTSCAMAGKCLGKASTAK